MCAWVRLHVYVYVCGHMYMRVCVYMYDCTLCVRVCMRACFHVYMGVCTRVYMCSVYLPFHRDCGEKIEDTSLRSVLELISTGISQSQTLQVSCLRFLNFFGRTL